QVDLSIALDLGKVPDPSQKGIADSGGAPAAARDLNGRFLADGHFEDVRGAFHNGGEQFYVVVFQTALNPKTGPHGSGEQPRTGSGPDQGKGAQIDLYGPGIGRSEEHTSELQSRENIVCRLL